MSNKLKVIGLALMAVFAFGAISATAAQAAPNWTVEGKEFTGEAALAEEATTKEIASGKHYILTVSGLLRITCTTLKIDEGRIFNKTENTAKSLTFFGCVVQNTKGETQAGCTTSDLETGKPGEIHTKPVLSRLVTIGGKPYITFVPDPEPNTLFVTIKVAAASGKTCGLSGEFETTGKAAVQPESGTNAVELGAETSQAIMEAAGTELKFGTRVSFIDGKGGLKLASGKTWGINP